MADLKICTECYEFSFGELDRRGGCLIEIVLWCAFIVPGLIYSIWRRTNTTRTCPKCGGTVIPADTPRGRDLAKRFH
jgi:hypothetical protein